MTIKVGSKIIATDYPKTVSWGSLEGNIEDQEDLKQLLDTKLDSVSAELTGTPTAPTPTAGLSNNQIATTKFVSDAIAASGEIPPMEGHSGQFLTTDGLVDSWASLPTEIEWATYGTTTWQQVKTWHDAGKLVCVNHSSDGIYILSLINSVDNSITFTHSTNSTGVFGYITLNTSNLWSVGSYSTQSIIPAGTSGQVVTYTGTQGVVGSADLPQVDQTYNGSSINAQSGVAVAEAIYSKQDTLIEGDNISITPTQIIGKNKLNANCESKSQVATPSSNIIIDFEKWYAGVAYNGYMTTTSISNFSSSVGSVNFKSSDASYGICKFVKLKPNTAYTISCSSPTTNHKCAIACYIDNGDSTYTATTYIRTPQTLPLTFSTNTNTAYGIVLYSPVNTEISYTNLMLEEGISASSYVEYTNTNAAEISVTGLSDYAPLNSPALTGTPTAPTAAVGTNTTQIATTAFVTNAITNYSPYPSQTGNSGKFLTTDGSDVSWVQVVQDKTYIHEQATASSTWTIQHNLNKYPAVSVVDSSGNEVITDVTYTDLNNLTITMTAAFKGKAYLN